MKRIVFLILLVAAMTMGILQGCGSSSSPDTRAPFIGTWVTTTENSVGKTLVFTNTQYSISSKTGSWENVTTLLGGGITLSGFGAAGAEVRLNVISVTETTLVVTIGSETTQITYTKTVAATPSPSPTPTPTPTPVPTPTPTPTPVTFTALPASITVTHTIGSSPCPQTLGTVTVSNTGSSTITVTIPAVTDLSFDKTSFSVAAGASTTVTVQFTCDNVPPLTKTVTINATSGGVTSSKTVAVQLNKG